MGCGCKDDNIKEVSEKGPINIKSVLKKLISGILLLSLVVILSPIILVMIWYFAVKIILGSDENVINSLVNKFTKDKDVEEENEELNNDEYELMDVDIIK